LASFEEQAPGTEKPAIGTTSYRNQMLRARQTMVIERYLSNNFVRFLILKEIKLILSKA